MNIANLIHSLDRFGRLLPQLISGVLAEDAMWKPEDKSWSILEVVCHLVDEEVMDFRPRLKSVLNDPSEAWQSWDPEGLAVERNYNQQDLSIELNRFVAERKVSLAWLSSLENPRWENAYQHPRLGPIRAGDLMLSWTAHDQMHLRQMTKRMFEMNLRDGTPFSSIYGGEWKA